MSKFWMRHVQGSWRPVVGGRVACQLHDHDIEVEECAACPWLLSFDLTSDAPAVRCRPLPPPSYEARSFTP